MRSSPIYIETICGGRKTNPAFGAREYCDMSVLVGTSSTNSKWLASARVSYTDTHGYRAFRFMVDTGDGLECMAKKWMHLKTHDWSDSQPIELGDAIINEGLRASGAI